MRCAYFHIGISTHTSLAGGDDGIKRLPIEYLDFNPHLPRGRRRRHTGVGLDINDFNPHLPRGRRRTPAGIIRGADIISTHTSLAGGDTNTV